ncbi:MAG: hypothetical protein CVU71_13545 [Deltaproteobacteria bacterium HGW-Deltaproteobacteria-6]|nr:MAG: hypothetical protein CVU71_13545 [Deltaproteobacteria bacterium HGW-Deltaproteobacteria-6]
MTNAFPVCGCNMTSLAACKAWRGSTRLSRNPAVNPLLDEGEKSRFISPVKFITHNRITHSQQVRTYLMKPSRFGKTPDKRHITGRENFPKPCQSLLQSCRI